MCSDKAIEVTSLAKCFHIYSKPRDRLKQMVAPRVSRLFRSTPKQYFREFWALNDVSFSVKKGETVGIIGRNGSGKSTLLQIICGTLTQTRGTVVTHGRIAALLELGSGFNPEFTGRENIYMNAAILGLSRKEVEQKFDEIVAFADIGEFIEQPVKTYSSGMTVRLAFAVQAVIEPDIFVVDEALAVGDEKFQRKCFARLEKLKSKGCAILFVSHSAESIVELCDRTLLLDHGQRIMFSSAPETIRAYQKLIYAPDVEKDRLINQYLQEDKTMGSRDKKEQDESASIPNSHSFESFDSGLVSESAIAYPSQGAEIKSIRILNAKGHQVNILQPGANYTIEVAGKLMTNFSGIFFGVHIRSISGVVITGQRYPEEGKFLEVIDTGKSFRVDFSFKMDVLPGSYFIGGGIWSSQEPNCAHRILDAIMFRVVPVNKPISFGYVDMSTKVPNAELF